MNSLFTHGQRVILKARRGKKEQDILAVFQEMQTKARAIVWADPVTLDDDGMRVVDLRSLRPYYNDPSDQQRRARHAMRLFKQGIRWFRLGGPDGVSFNAMQMDIVDGNAFGCKRKRKTILSVPIHDLWPEQS
jgi:hypothetical protein